jgi:glycosyltransferase involved in cell wall biosynthesis
MHDSARTAMMTGRNIVCFANDWDADPTSKHQVMKILSRSNRVLWVNSIGLRRPDVSVEDASRIVRKIRQWFSGPKRINDNMYAVTPLVIPFHQFRWVRRVNAWLASWYVRAQAKRLGMKGFQVWVFLPSAASIIPHLNPEKVVYYCVDEWSAFSFLDATAMRELEEHLLAQSDIVFVSAEELHKNKSPFNPRTYLVPHGVDNEHFAKARLADTALAPELNGLHGPVIGFWGAIHDWIDLDVVKQMAIAHPDWSIVMVGKVSVDIADFAALPNVHFTGGRPYAALPGFAKGFTAAILPFKINRLTASVNPIKLREYLAAGLPVVSTPLPEVKAYDGLIRIGSTVEEFVRQVEGAVNDTSDIARQRRMDAIRKDTWISRVEYMSSLVESLYP